MASYLRLFAVLTVGYGAVFALFVPHYYYFDRGDYILVKGWASPGEIFLVSLVAGGIFAAASAGAFALWEAVVARFLRWPMPSDSSDSAA